MLKHPDLTLSRVTQWLSAEITPKLLGARAPLSVEFCGTPHFTADDAAKKGPWESVEPGFVWGPAYRECWFRIRGSIPRDWEGAEVLALLEVGGERTVWGEHGPDRGVDREHRQYRVLDRCAGGETVDLLVQSHAGAPHVRVHGVLPEREPTTEKVGVCELVCFNTHLQPLAYDVDFALGLAKKISRDDPAFATILRALNDACNVWAEGGDEAIPRCRKLIRDALAAVPNRLKHTIYPLGHAHLDTAWLWPLRITHLKMAHTASTQLYLMDRYPEYIYVHSQASQYEWMEREYPALFHRIQAAAERGQWEPIGSMWVEADCNLTGAESLVRQFLYGRRYFEQKFGRVTEDMFLPDVFGYSAALPQILQKFGIKAFCTQKISWNQFNKFPHNTFWWQGIDGSKIWTHFPPADTYIGNCEAEELIRSCTNHKDQGRSDTSLYLFGWGDGGGGPTERHLEFLRRARTAPALPTIERGKAARDFYRDARRASKDLVTWVGELYLELHRGTYTSQAVNKRANRECEFLLRDVEWLCSFSGQTYPQEKIERLWKTVLLNQFHDIIPGSSVTEVYEDSDRDYAEIRSGAHELLEGALRGLASKIQSADAQRPVAVFHNATVPSQVTLGWEGGDAPASVRFGDVRLPVQSITDLDGQHKLIFETPAEALGTVAVGDLTHAAPTSKNRLRVAPRRLENDQWSVRFDANGNITSIVALDDDSTEFIEPGQLANMFQILDDHPLFWDAWDVDAYSHETVRDLVKSESFEIVERGPVRVAVEVVKKFGQSTIRQRISLGPTPGIRFDTWVDWHEEHKFLKVAFPFNVNSQRATFEIQFGHVERPTHANTTWDMAKFEVCAQKWADMSEGDFGIALINQGKYGHDVRGNVMRLSLLRSPKAPDPQCDMGEHHFSYVLLPHFDQVRHSDVVAAAYAFNAEPRALEVPASEGVMPELPSLVAVSSRDIVIESVKRAEDHDRLIVRMYECHNTRASAEVACAVPIKKAWLVDLNETPVEELEVVDDLVRFDYKPFEIVTLMLEV